MTELRPGQIHQPVHFVGMTSWSWANMVEIFYAHHHPPSHPPRQLHRTPPEPVAGQVGSDELTDHRNLRTQSRKGIGHMSTVLLTIQAPPVGELELSGPQPSDPTQQQMDEEQTARDDLVKTLVASLQSLQNQTKFAHVGTVAGFDLLGNESWSKLNNYLLLLQISHGNIDTEWVVKELQKALPDRSHISVSDVFVPLASSSSSNP
jgi:hypothetical protein